MALVENNSCWTHSHAVCEGESICLCMEIKNSFLLEECLPQWVLLFLVSWSKQWLARWLHSHLNVVLAHLNIKLSACQQKDIWMHVINWTGCCNKIVEMSLFISTPKNRRMWVFQIQKTSHSLMSEVSILAPGLYSAWDRGVHVRPQTWAAALGFVPLSSTQVTGRISPNIRCKLTDHKSANLNSSKQGHNSQVTTCKLAQ